VHEGAVQGRRALDEGAYAQASAALERAVHDAPEELSYWVDLGRAYMGQGRGQEASQAFQRAIDLAPEEARFWVYLGHARELSRQYELAEQAYREGVEREPKRAWPRRVLGARLLRWGRASEAVPVLEQALRLDPDHAETYHALAIALTQDGDVPRAESVLHAGLQHFSKARGLQLALAALLINRAAYAEALAIYDDVVEGWPSFVPAHIGRAVLLAQLGRKQEAQVALARATQLDPRARVYEQQLQLQHQPQR
jgi:Flp pilus assembly protein TadD